MNDPIKLLIIDDDSDLLTMMTECMRTIPDLKVLRASSCREAESIIEKERPRVIITDVSLGDGNGLNLISKSRNTTKATQVIVMTGNSEMERVLDALEQGAVDYICKPFDILLFKKIVQEACHRVRRWEFLFKDELKRRRKEQPEVVLA